MRNGLDSNGKHFRDRRRWIEHQWAGRRAVGRNLSGARQFAVLEEICEARDHVWPDQGQRIGLFGNSIVPCVIIAERCAEEIRATHGLQTDSVNPSSSICLDVNGRRHMLEIPGRTLLLHVLRNDLELNGPKFGCGLGECGACAVLVDGDCVRSCVVPVGNVVGRKIVTLEGLGDARRPHPVQQAFIAAQAAQCGYCLNGMIMATKALLDHNAHPTDAEIKQALRFHLCRCGTHLEILDAVRRARDAHTPISGSP